MRRAYKTLYREGLSLEDAKREAREPTQRERPALRPLVEFLAVAGRGIVR